MASYLDLSQNTQAILALVTVGVMFALFVREVYPPEVTAIAGAAAMLVLGLLPYEDAVAVLQNNAPWTIAAMFIVMGALVRTGALVWFTRIAEAQADSNPALAIGALMIFVVVASAFVNNTPVVLVMIPVFVQLAQRLGVSASKLLIPLSYVAILGGTLTLIGTSTNLLVDGVARARGIAPFTIFEVTPLALILCIWGGIYMYFVAPRLLPDRASMATMLGDRAKMKFFTELAIPEHSSFVGRPALGIDLFRRDGVRLIDVLRGDASLRRNLKDVTLEAGDRVVLRTEMTEILGLKASPDLATVDQPADADDDGTGQTEAAQGPDGVDKLSSRETTTVEVLITPDATLVGRSLGSLRLRRRYGVYPLAVHRRNQNIGRQLDDVVVRVGDTLLLEGAPEDIGRLAADADLVNVSQPTERAYRRSHAPLALIALAGIVLLAAFGIAPILLLAVVAIAVLFLTRCIDADEAFSVIDGRLLALIFAMLAIGAALENSGAVSLIATAVAPQLQGLPPFFVVWAIYLLTSILTEMVSNNAIAVVVTPIAIGLAGAMDIDARPLIVAVMIAASASFATPIGYQTNMMVYGPGGYKFTDFMRVGIPLNLSVGLLASALIPFIWPL